MAKVLLATNFAGVEIQVQGNGSKDAVANLKATLDGLLPQSTVVAAEEEKDADPGEIIENFPDEEAK